MRQLIVRDAAQNALVAGAALAVSISSGKDSQAMLELKLSPPSALAAMARRPV